MTIREALWGTPVNALFALLPALRERHGGNSDGNYADMAADAARLRAREFLSKHYRII